MDWIKEVLPDDSMTLWLVIMFAASALLNIYQFAKAHGLATKVKTLLELGHAPDGKVIVPAVDVARSVETTINQSYIPLGRPVPSEVLRIFADGKVIYPQPSIPPLPWEKS